MVCRSDVLYGPSGIENCSKDCSVLSGRTRNAVMMIVSWDACSKSPGRSATLTNRALGATERKVCAPGLKIVCGALSLDPTMTCAWMQKLHQHVAQ